jgi:hypothetical protein
VCSVREYQCLAPLKVELYAAIRRNVRAAMSARAVEPKYHVGIERWPQLGRSQGRSCRGAPRSWARSRRRSTMPAPYFAVFSAITPPTSSDAVPAVARPSRVDEVSRFILCAVKLCALLWWEAREELIIASDVYGARASCNPDGELWRRARPSSGCCAPSASSAGHRGIFRLLCWRRHSRCLRPCSNASCWPGRLSSSALGR